MLLKIGQLVFCIVSFVGCSEIRNGLKLCNVEVHVVNWHVDNLIC